MGNLDLDPSIDGMIYAFTGIVIPAMLRDATLTTTHRLPCLPCLHISLYGSFCVNPSLVLCYHSVVSALISKLASPVQSLNVTFLGERPRLDVFACLLGADHAYVLFG